MPSVRIRQIQVCHNDTPKGELNRVDTRIKNKLATGQVTVEDGQTGGFGANAAGGKESGISDRILKLLSLYTVDELRLSGRIRYSLSKAGIVTMDQLIRLTDGELVSLPGLGKKSVYEIRTEHVNWISKNDFVISHDFDSELADGKKAVYTVLANRLEPVVPLDDRMLYHMCKTNNVCSAVETGDVDNMTEDYYSTVFSYFSLNRDQFYDVFPDADCRTYEYLSMRYTKGEVELDRTTVKGYSGIYLSDLVAYLDRNGA